MLSGTFIYKCATNYFHSFIFIFILLACSYDAYSQIPSHYNVLFIAVDDMNDRCTLFRNNEVITPNLERLAAHGMVFKAAYCQYPLCSPSRTSLLSGWRPDKTKIFTNDIRPRTVMGADVKFLPEYFKEYGYHTERYGKIFHGKYENDITWNYAEPP